MQQIFYLLTGKQFQELLDSVVSRKPVVLVLEGFGRVDLDALDHKADVVGDAILIKV